MNKINKYLNKIEEIIKQNKEENKLNNIILLIFKTILKNLNLLEKDEYIQKLVVKRIKHLLTTNLNHTNSIYTHKTKLTKLSEESILNIYRKYGFKACINISIIMEYYHLNNLNFNLFFNQVSKESDIVVDYFKVQDLEKFETIEFKESFFIKNGYINLNY